MLSDKRFEKKYSPSFIRILSFIGVGLILFCLSIILITPCSTNYEFSIYDAYPFIFWLALFAAIFVGSSILLINIEIAKQDEKFWIFGISILILANLILLFMPIIRGYFNFGYGDVLTHIGWMKDIIRTGYISSSNMYPIDHILGVILNRFTGISLQDITMIVPALFSLFYIISLYLLSTIFFSKQYERMLLLAITSIPVIGYSQTAFTPYSQAFMLLPFLLFLLMKNNFSEGKLFFSFLLMIICTLIVFFHPLITVFIISIFMILKMISWIHKKKDVQVAFNKNLNILIFLLIILFCAWSSYLYVLTRTVKPIFDSISGSSEFASQFKSYSNLLGQVNIDLPHLIQLIVNIYGQVIVLGLLSLICTTYLLLKVIKREKISFISQFSLVCFLTFFIISILFFFISGSFGFNRIYLCALIFSIMLISITILLMDIGKKRDRILLRVVFLAILAMIIWVSLFNFYFSPIIKQPNLQVTKSEYSGMQTFYQFRFESYPILEHGLSQKRMYDAIYGSEYPRINVRYPSPGYSLLPPVHFNFISRSLSRENTNEYNYFLLTNQGKFFYQNMYPEFQQNWRFTSGDFERLEYDVFIQKIFQNGNLEVRLIG